MSDLDSAALYAQRMRLALRSWDDDRPRSKQTQDHKLGVSDIGGCHNYAALLTTQTPFTDAPSRGAAIMGTFIHDGLVAVKKHDNPNLLLDLEVTATLPNGVSLTGHPDEVDKDENSVTDDKTVDGLGLVKLNGPTERQRYQVALYALGLIQMGVLDKTRPVITRLAFWDRAGKQDEPYVWQKEWDEQDIRDAVEWLDDVIYAVQHAEQASKDKPVDWCASSCPYYSTCRLPDLPEVDDLITDGETVDAAVAYRTGLSMENEGKAIKRAAKSQLDGTSGIIVVDDAHRLRLRWISVDEVTVKETTRAAHKRIDLRDIG